MTPRRTFWEFSAANDVGCVGDHREDAEVFRCKSTDVEWSGNSLRCAGASDL